MWYKIASIQNNVQDIISFFKEKYPEVELIIYELAQVIELSRIRVPKNMQDSGIGSEILSKLKEYSDQVGKPIVLYPEHDKGKKTELRRFYKKNDFVPNKGRNKDFSFREPLYYKNIKTSSYLDDDPIAQRIRKISSKIAAAAQSVYDDWDPKKFNSEEEYRDAWGVGGICNYIAKEIADVVKAEFPEFTVLTQNEEGSHCNHEYVQVVAVSNEAFDIPSDENDDETVDVYDIDIPYSCYEICNSYYDFSRIDDVELTADSVSIYKHSEYLSDIREY
jgi:hypothetical protein